ncbi:major facilitator superfamily domain-containing protein [Achaetomium macrosporum]|uniref:Major facilitator superfamily domain-containing protein n=1 Tax=Achaetomium macrosporum TaxID=79813 RepID=A0AAN7C5F6_9PEZI|nr:major facilitator superfamily domain-containing protein [Achaetomium macrosporum]
MLSRTANSGHLGVESALEKMAISHDELPRRGGLSPEDAEFLANFSDEKKKKVMWKIDLRLIPMLLSLYLIAYLDKTNIGNAKIEGLLHSLNMTGDQYNIALSIFFIPYVLGEVPSNMLLKNFKHPSYYLGMLVLLWGIIMTCTGFVQNFSGLVAVRFLLGLFEAGFFPGAILLISEWYLPNETQKRIALMYTSAATGGAFSGLLAFALAKMDGLAGLEGWRWIFIIEGLATVCVGLLCFFVLLDSPALSAGFLTPEEVRYLELRQMARRVYVPKEEGQSSFDWGCLWSVATDWKMYLLILANWSQAVPNYAMKFTMPTIVKSMGFTSATAQLLTIPPYACGAVSAYLLSVFADRSSWRMPYIVGPQVCVVVAFSLLFSKAAEIQTHIAVCYFGVCLACFGMYPIFPGVNAWNVVNTAGPIRRAISIGYLVCAGNIGGVVGSYIYKDNEVPKYTTGYGTSLAFGSAGILAALALEYGLWQVNKRDAQMTEEEVRARYSDEQLEKMGDKSPLYRYCL